MLLRVAEGGGTWRTVAPCTVTVASGEGHGWQGLDVADYVRGSLPPAHPVGTVTCAPGGPRGDGSSNSVTAGHVAEWNRFARYLWHGVEGTSPPKAARVIPTPASAAHTGGASQAYYLLVADGTAGTSTDAAPAVLQLLQPTAPPTTTHGTTALNSGAGIKRPRPQDEASLTGAGGGGQGRVGGLRRPPPSPPPAVVYTRHGTHYVSQEAVASAEASMRRGGDARPMTALVEGVVDAIVRGVIPFPFKAPCVDDADVPSWFRILQGYPHALRLERGPFTLHGFYPRSRTVPCTGVRLALAPPSTTTTATASTGLHGTPSAHPPLRLVPTPITISPANVVDVAGVGPCAIPFDKEYNELGGILVDYWSEPARMAAVRRDEHEPPVTLWRRPEIARKCVEKAIRKDREVSDYSLRRGMYGHISGCNLFKCHLAHAIYSLFGATRVLDMCAGWGDRLMGAMSVASIARYVAFDPNPALVTPHNAMIARCGGLGGGSYVVHSAPFEMGVWSEEDGAAGFDLAFTSPPYFDLEIYETGAAGGGGGDGAASCAGAGGGGRQSIATHPTLSAWLTGWYFPMMDKAWAAVRRGGHLAIYINDHAGSDEPAAPASTTASAGASASRDAPIDICIPMLAHAATWHDCQWVGAVGIVGETGKVRPLWVWRKDDGGAADAVPLPPLYHVLAGRTDVAAAMIGAAPPPPPPVAAPSAKRGRLE